MPEKTCWIIYDKGKAGTGNQCIGLAEALGFRPVIYEVSARFPWKYLPSSLWFNAARAVVTHEGAYLAPPWPDIIIAAGRASAAPVAAIGRMSGGKAKTIQLLNPRISPHHFDMVIAPRHDCYSGPNVIQTKGALHRVTDERLARDAEKFQPQIAHLPKPLVVVLMGGTSRRFTLDGAVIEDLKNKLNHWVQAYGVGIAILPSRRTSPENRQALAEAFKDMPAVIWDCESENPYFGYLGLADYIVVTSDSVSMTSEACYTGKPVYTYHLPGGSAIFNRFHQALEQEGYTKPMGEKLESWAYPKLDELSAVVTEIKQRFNL